MAVYEQICQVYFPTFATKMPQVLGLFPDIPSTLHIGYGAFGLKSPAASALLLGNLHSGKPLRAGWVTCRSGFKRRKAVKPSQFDSTGDQESDYTSECLLK